MKAGEVKFEVETPNSSSGSPFLGGGMPQIPGMTERTTSTPYWEEKTGRKTGFIIKTDEKATIPLTGLRCTSCGFLELYAPHP
jgi:hypothetical protein